MPSRRASVRAVLLMLLAVALPAVVLAQSPEDQARTISRELMSPYCPGLLLADCQSEGARVLRAEILRRLREGETPAAVEQAVVARFGAEIRTTPAFSGFGIIAWMIPAVVGVAGLFLVVVVVRRSARRSRGMAPAFEGDPPPDGAMGTRVQDELDALD